MNKEERRDVGRMLHIGMEQYKDFIAASILAIEANNYGTNIDLQEGAIIEIRRSVIIDGRLIDMAKKFKESAELYVRSIAKEE